MEYLAASVAVASFNPFVGPSPRTKISFFLISACTNELVSTPKIPTLLRHSLIKIAKVDQI